MKFHIHTSTDYFKVDNDLNIIRTDIAHTASGGWKFLGIEHVRRNEFIRASDLTPARLAEIQWKYKNGNPQYRVRDLDHGTVRTWGAKLSIIETAN